MSLIIGGHFRLAPEDIEPLRPHMDAMIAATRAEDGCEVYGFAEDVLEPGLIRVFEIWRDQAALDAHAKAPHMAAWIAARAQLGVVERKLDLYEVASSRPL